jgi:hypothetical protein
MYHIVSVRLKLKFPKTQHKASHTLGNVSICGFRSNMNPNDEQQEKKVSIKYWGIVIGLNAFINYEKVRGSLMESHVAELRMSVDGKPKTDTFWKNYDTQNDKLTEAELLHLDAQLFNLSQMFNFHVLKLNGAEISPRNFAYAT